MIAHWKKWLVLLFCAGVPVLMAPTGGFPSRPVFQAIGINATPTPGTEKIRLRGIGADASAFISFFNTSGVRTGYMQSVFANDLQLANEVSGGNISLITTGTGQIQTNGVNITASAGSFTPGWTGFSVNPSSNAITYARIGNVVVLSLPTQSTGVSNAITMSITGLPAALSPARTQSVACGGFTDNTAPVLAMGNCVISGTTITFFKDTWGSATFTAAGAKAPGIATLTYLLN